MLQIKNLVVFFPNRQNECVKGPHFTLSHVSSAKETQELPSTHFQHFLEPKTIFQKPVMLFLIVLQKGSSFISYLIILQFNFFTEKYEIDESTKTFNYYVTYFIEWFSSIENYFVIVPENYWTLHPKLLPSQIEVSKNKPILYCFMNKKHNLILYLYHHMKLKGNSC